VQFLYFIFGLPLLFMRQREVNQFWLWGTSSQPASYLAYAPAAEKSGKGKGKE
jgi:hypothetical protein